MCIRLPCHKVGFCKLWLSRRVPKHAPLEPQGGRACARKWVGGGGGKDRGAGPHMASVAGARVAGQNPPQRESTPHQVWASLCDTGIGCAARSSVAMLRCRGVGPQVLACA